ncbi:hypothetical protein PG988_014931 [Apiospora saccharicola]
MTLESLAVELKVMILKESDAASILSLISASPTFHRIFYRYYTDILEHSVSCSSGVRPEVLYDALAAASLPYPPYMNNADKETRKDEAAALKAVQLWRDNKFAFVPAARGSPPRHYPLGCIMPGFDPDFHLHHGVVLARLSCCVGDFIEDYVAKSRCDPLKDFYVYNNVPEWADETLKSLKPTSPLRSWKKKAVHLTDNELIKFQRAFFRFEFYARVHAHSANHAEYNADTNPLIKLAPSQTEEVACAYSYLYSLQMLAFEETDKVDELKTRMVDGRTFPVCHLSNSYSLNQLDTDILLRAKLASGIKRVWDSVTEPYKKRRELISDDIHRRIQAGNPTLGNNEFMRGVLNADPQCCLRSCCSNRWGLVSKFQVHLLLF